jgi:hypothetical protein
MRSPPLLLTMFAALALTRCSAGSASDGANATPGEDASTGSKGSSSRDGSAPPSPTATGSAPAPTGTGASPSPADGGEDDAAADTNRDSATADGIPQDFFVRYEAESSINVLTYPVEGVVSDGASSCKDGGLKEGANCASGGKIVDQILGRSPCQPPTSTSSYDNCQNKGGGVLFKQVTVPVDGTYDVTVWYHSGGGGGNADTYGDSKCGGVNYQTGTGSGCRPHLIDVNGVPVSGTIGGKTALYYEFPAYPTAWSYVHGAVVALALKAGDNTIYIHAPGFTTSDAADLDALDVQPSGSGAPHFQASGNGGPPTLPIGPITPVVNWN